MRAILTLLLLAASFLAHAAEPRIAVIYEGSENAGTTEFRQAIASLPSGARVDFYAAGTGGLVLRAETDLAGYDLVFDLAGYDLVFLDGATRNLPLDAEKIERPRAATKFVIVNPQPGLEGNVPLAEHPDLALYWANRSTDNDAALFFICAGRYWACGTAWKRPGPSSIRRMPSITPTYRAMADSPRQRAAQEHEGVGRADCRIPYKYGHVLGLEHSTDSHDFMAATLQPGVHRLPSIEELALLSPLLADADFANGENGWSVRTDRGELADPNRRRMESESSIDTKLCSIGSQYSSLTYQDFFSHFFRITIV
jgi:hypothetical protein